MNTSFAYRRKINYYFAFCILHFIYCLLIDYLRKKRKTYRYAGVFVLVLNFFLFSIMLVIWVLNVCIYIHFSISNVRVFGNKRVLKNDFVKFYRFLPGHENYTLIINMDTNYTQRIRLSDKISNLCDSLTVVVGSVNSNFDTGLVHNNK